MCSPVLLYWVSVLCRQEAARIRAEFSNVTDDPGGEQSLTLFTPHFSSSTPPLMCSFKPSLSAAAERTFHLLWPPPSSVPCGSHYGQLYFPSQSSVCVCFVCVCASPHFSAETQSVHRGQSSWVDCSEMTLFFFFICFLATKYVTLMWLTTYVILFCDRDLGTWLASVGDKECSLLMSHHVLCWKGNVKLLGTVWKWLDWAGGPNSVWHFKALSN